MVMLRVANGLSVLKQNGLESLVGAKGRGTIGVRSVDCRGFAEAEWLKH